jgi:hypothetical protein
LILLQFLYKKDIKIRCEWPSPSSFKCPFSLQLAPYGHEMSAVIRQSRLLGLPWPSNWEKKLIHRNCYFGQKFTVNCFEWYHFPISNNKELIFLLFSYPKAKCIIWLQIKIIFFYSDLFVLTVFRWLRIVKNTHIILNACCQSRGKHGFFFRLYVSTALYVPGQSSALGPLST